MHEYSLMENVTEAITQQLKEQGVSGTGVVKKVTLKVGSLDIHSEASFRQAFSMQTPGTVLDSAELALEVYPGWIECKSCHHRGDIKVGEADCHDPYPIAECPKCGTVCLVQGGHGIEPIDLVVEERTSNAP